MADVKITALTAISTNPVNPATFPIPMVDLLDTSMAASGTTKKVTVNQLLGSGGTATLASATITGDLTVDTSTLKVDSTNNRVGIVQATPLYPLHLVGEFGLEEASSGNGTKLRFIGDASKYNFRLGKQLTASNTFEITPSTAIGGTTFSNPVYTVTYDGTHTFLDGAGSTRMTLNSTGLGIGIASASISAKLHIDGNFKINGATSEILMATGSERTISASGSSGSTALTFKRWNGSSYVSDVVMDGSGNLLVGTTNTDPTLNRVNGVNVRGNAGILMRTPSGFSEFGLSVTSGIHVYFASDNGTARVYGGNISTNGSTTAYNTTSDYRLKESVQPLVGGLARVNALKPSVYKWKSDGLTGEGFLAHELAEIVPIAVTGEKDAVRKDGSIEAQGVDLSKLVPILVAAIQELTAEVNALKNA
jgi:hypothetical protein